MPDTAVPTNGASTVHDLFALSDEQILEIEAEPQDIEIADVYLDDADRAVLVAPVHPDAGRASLPAGFVSADASQNRRQDAGATGRDRTDVGAQHAAPQLGNTSTTSHGGDDTAESSAAAGHPSPVTSHDTSVPPQWLADRMSDPQAGAEARALWDSVQQSKAESAGFREIFAKPEEARAAAQRARLLDDIDRAYFGGDATQRASLAASMMREDPAAFREMVFAGLRALQEGAQSTSARGDASPRANIAAPGGAAGNSGSSPSPNSVVNDELATPQPGARTSQAALARTNDTARGSAAHRAVAPSQPSEAADESAASDSSTQRSASDSARAARHPPRSDRPAQHHASDDASPNSTNRAADAARFGAANQLRTDSQESSRQDARVAANYAAFERSTNDDLERIVGGAIDRTLDRALPHSNRADNASMRTRLAASIRQDIERSLQGDRQLGEQVSQVLSARRLDEATRSQVVRIIGERAQQLVAGTTKRVLGEWTQTTLAAHRERSDRANATVSRRDVEPANTSQARPANASASASSSTASALRSVATTPRGPSSGRSTAPPSPRSQKLDYRRVTDEQILDF